jgi:hypothetical protein
MRPCLGGGGGLPSCVAIGRGPYVCLDQTVPQLAASAPQVEWTSRQVISRNLVRQNLANGPGLLEPAALDVIGRLHLFEIRP